MSHKQKKSLRQQGNDRLREMYAKGKGTSKHSDKVVNRGKPDPEKIYTDATLRIYKRGWNDFCDYLLDNGIHTKSMDAASEYVQQYIDRMKAKGISAYTIHTWVSAVCKVVAVPLSTYDMPKRYRRSVKRSRYPAVRDAHFSEYNNLELVEFCRAVGPRNHKELQKIRGTNLVKIGDGYGIHIVQGKGGKERIAPIIGPEHIVAEIAEMCEKAGEEVLFKHVSSAADIHSYRAEYACRVYRKYARELKDIPSGDRYYCRSDMQGRIFDKRAMRLASEALGHSRIDVIAQSYLWMLFE